MKHHLPGCLCSHLRKVAFPKFVQRKGAPGLVSSVSCFPDDYINIPEDAETVKLVQSGDCAILKINLSPGWFHKRTCMSPMYHNSLPTCHQAVPAACILRVCIGSRTAAHSPAGTLPRHAGLSGAPAGLLVELQITMLSFHALPLQCCLSQLLHTRLCFWHCSVAASSCTSVHFFQLWHCNACPLECMLLHWF